MKTTTPLFADGEWTCIPLPGAEVKLNASFLSPPEADSLLTRFTQEISWEQRDVFVWGAWRKQPRLTAWYGDEGAAYSYSGIHLQPRTWTPALTALRSRIEAKTGQKFNSVLLNYYRDHNDGMGWHSDDEPELGPRPIIASVSFGEERVISFRHRHDKQSATHKVPLPHGSLLLMAGNTQANWHHAIAKQKTQLGPRINLTFRRIVER